MTVLTVPIPPGTGVIAEATALTPSKSTSPTVRPSRSLIPTSTTTAPGLIIGAVISRETFSFPGGSRFHFIDPDGYELAVWTAQP